MKNKMQKIRRLFKILGETLTIAIRIKILDIKIFFEGLRCKGGFSGKQLRWCLKSISLSKRGMALTDEGLAICNELNEGVA